MSSTRKMLVALGVPVALLMLIQLVPYGRDRSMPPAGETASWSNSETRDLARRACFDCHSNETRWPWYAAIAPLSWRIQDHVAEGREHLNFSAFAAHSEKMTEAAGEAGEAVLEGEMPPRDYLLLHPEARLNPEERRALAAGLDRTFAAFVDMEERGGKARNAEGRERAQAASTALAEGGRPGEAAPAALRSKEPEEDEEHGSRD